VKLYDQAFVVTSKQTGKPMPYEKYRIVRADGSVEPGVTDQDGLTHVVAAAEAEAIRIELGD
jgi:type VI secretion system secreted protein VgrG